MRTEGMRAGIACIDTPVWKKKTARVKGVTRAVGKSLK